MADKRSRTAELSTFHRIVASSIGGVVTALIMTPLDVVKIRMQARRTLQHKCFIYCNGLMEHLCTCPPDFSSSRAPWYKKPGNFTGTWVGSDPHGHSKYSPNCVYHSRNASFGIFSPHSLQMTDAFYKIVRNEGIWSLWSGLSPTLVMALPQTVIYFTLNDWMKDRLGYASTENSLGVVNRGYKSFSANDWTPAVVGGISRTVAVAAISPLELLRTKMQASNVTARKLSRVFSVSVKQEGVLSLWTGMGPMLLRDVPYSMIFWLFFDYLKTQYVIRHFSDLEIYSPDSIKPKELPFYGALTYGAASGLIAGVFTHPFDVVKTHRQVELGEALASGQRYPKSTWISLNRLYASSGIRAVFSGFTPRLLKTTFASAVMIATFEYFKGYFSKAIEQV